MAVRDHEREAVRELKARRAAVRRNAEKGPGRNLEEAIRMMRFGDRFRAAFRRGRR